MTFGKGDEIQIEIMEDGLIKTTTDPISGANHSSAEQLLKYVATLAGGETTIKRNGSGTHTHGTFTHEHEEKKAGH